MDSSVVMDMVCSLVTPAPQGRAPSPAQTGDTGHNARAARAARPAHPWVELWLSLVVAKGVWSGLAGRGFAQRLWLVMAKVVEAYPSGAVEVPLVAVVGGSEAGREEHESIDDDVGPM